MIIYSVTKARFQEDVDTNNIDNIILSAFKAVTGHTTSRSEIASWKNSLQCMERILNDGEIPHDAGVSIEYHIRSTCKRIDFILTGRDACNKDSAVLIELKQWTQATLTAKDAIIMTRFSHGEVETPHPSYQAWSYKRILEDFNQTVQEEPIRLYPCAYLHNYAPDSVISNPFYADYIKKAPLFLKGDAEKLRQFIKQHVKYGDKNRLMYRIDEGKIKPSKALADQLSSMLKGNEEFVMIDDQKVVYETALSLVAKAAKGNKQVFLVEGGPGTGKSVVAISLLVALTNREAVVHYVTRNSAPRVVYEAKLTGSLKKSQITNLFSGSGSYHSVVPDSSDCLIVDEAHRLNEKSGRFNHLGTNQIMEIVRASKCSIFFIDEDQKVTLKDIGDKGAIRHWAKAHGAEVTELELASQFRCNGSDGYLSWVDSALQIKETANDELDTRDYDFRIISTPAELHALIREKNKDRNKARLVAGYCWDWVSKKNPAFSDITIGNFKATWNLTDDGQAWIIKKDSVGQIGCIHTCQGLELDYVGVIIGPDLVVRGGRIVTDPSKRARTDRSISGWKTLFKKHQASAEQRLDAIIKNTYRTLMTRGQKGCYVYFTDEETRRYFQARIQGETEELIQYKNALPLLNLRAAADASYESLAGYFAQNDSFEWIRVSNGPFQKDRFLVRAEGDSMDPDIKDGDLCLFRKDPGGSRNGKIVLCQVGGFAGDAPVALIKRYRSARARGTESLGEAKAIVLSSINTQHDDIILSGGDEYSILGVFERVIEAAL
jgi:DUF2075 family protein/SOS-response transcriptional repressor LexA